LGTYTLFSNFAVFNSAECADFIEHGYSGEKAPEKTSSAYPLFKEAGLRGIFYLLQSPERVNHLFGPQKKVRGCP